MAFYPWTRFKKLFKQPWTPYVVVFAYNYLCNDISATVQKQGFGLITFVPYMALLSILAVDFVFSWIKAEETLPRHTQDTQMAEPRQAEDAKDEVMELKDSQQRTSSSKNKQSTVSRGGSINCGARVATTGNQKLAQTESTTQSNEAKDELIESKNQHRHRSSSKNKPSTVSRGGSINSGAGVASTENRRIAHTESTSQKNDVEGGLDSTNLQKRKSLSKNKCVPQAYEMPELHKPSIMFRSGTDTGSRMSGRARTRTWQPVKVHKGTL